MRCALDLGLAPAADSAGDGAAGANELAVGEAVLTVLSERDVTKARGLIHARHALTEDISFAWDEPVGGADPVWTVALRFSDVETSTTVVFSDNCERVTRADSGRIVSSAPIAKAISTFLDEHQPARAAATVP